MNPTELPNVKNLSPEAYAEARRRLLRDWPTTTPAASAPISAADLSDADYLAAKNALLRNASI